MADLTTVEPDVDEATDGPSPPDRRPGAPASTARRRPSRWTLLMAGLATLLVVLAAADVALFLHGEDPVAAQREPALAAARQVALDISSIDAGNAETRLAALREATTGPLHEEMVGYSTYLPMLVTQGQVAVSGATVGAAGLERLAARSAVALVAVSATVTSPEHPAGELRRYRLAVELRRDGDRWLASSVAYVP